MTKTLRFGVHTVRFTPVEGGVRVASESKGRWPHDSVVLMDRERALVRWAKLRAQGFVQV